MAEKNFNLSGTINIYYNDKLLLDEIQYRLLNLILTDGNLTNSIKELDISRNKAMGLINRMNRLAPELIVETGKSKGINYMQISNFGMNLLNTYAQKEFDLYKFLKSSNSQLNASFQNHSKSNGRVEPLLA